jgi:hypothetical protein
MPKTSNTSSGEDTEGGLFRCTLQLCRQTCPIQ